MDEYFTPSTLYPFTETDEGTVTMFAHAKTLFPFEREEDCFTIQVVLTFAFRHSSVNGLLSNPWRTEYTFDDLSLRAFREDTEPNQLDTLRRKITVDLVLPFDLEKHHISWAFDSCLESETMESISERLLRVARDVCLPENGGNRKMVIYIEKEITNVTLGDFKMLRDLNQIVQGENLLTDWFAENLSDLVDLQKDSSRCARQALFKLAREEEDTLCGLKSVEVAKEENEGGGGDRCCAICLKDLMQCEIGIGLPCSHLFHGFCILVWIDRKMTCPLCRCELV